MPGQDVGHNNFATDLWPELITKIKFKSSHEPGYRSDLRPALNWGLQVSWLKERSRNEMWMKDDMEMVYPDMVLNGEGEVKRNPIHVVVPGLIPLDLKIQRSTLSGLNGLLELFLPPFTSADPAIRELQSIALINALVQGNSRLIQSNIGFCPGWILGSQEPGTLKTTTALLGLLANGGDPALFLEAGSSAEAIEQLQGLSSFMVLVDDTKATSKIQKVLVGGFQNAKKALVGRSGREKLGGTCFTKNWRQEGWDPRDVAGRMVPQDMNKPATHESGNVSATYKANKAHIKALNTTHLPRDASAILSGKLLHNDVNADENKFTEAHLLACERLQEHEEFANSEPRRLHSLALAPAFLFLLADMVEDADSSKTTSLFVEALNSKDHFFEIYCSNLVKSEEIIQAGMIRAGGMKRKVHEVEDEDAAIDGEPTLDEKL